MEKVIIKSCEDVSVIRDGMYMELDSLYSERYDLIKFICSSLSCEVTCCLGDGWIVKYFGGDKFWVDYRGKSFGVYYDRFVDGGSLVFDEVSNLFDCGIYGNVIDGDRKNFLIGLGKFVSTEELLGRLFGIMADGVMKLDEIENEIKYLRNELG